VEVIAVRAGFFRWRLPPPDFGDGFGKPPIPEDLQTEIVPCVVDHSISHARIELYVLNAE
jgi:hypothetical protein